MKNDSSSFVILKQVLSKNQKNMISDYLYWINFFIENDNTIDTFKKIESKNWNITEYADFIFGETSNCDFDMNEYLIYISVNNRYIIFDNGSKKPSEMQLEFIEDRKLDFKTEQKEKVEQKIITKIDFKTSGTNELTLSKSKPSINGINFNKQKKHK